MSPCRRRGRARRAGPGTIWLAAVGAMTNACGLIFGIGDPDYRVAVTSMEDGSAARDALASADSDATPSAMEAGAADTSSPPDASVGVNLWSDGDFENGCSSWSAIGGRTTLVTNRRNGAKSCSFCAGSTSAATFVRHVDTAVPMGAELVGELWMRLDPVALWTIDSTRLVMAVRATGGADAGTGQPVNGAPVGMDWQPLAASVVASVEGDQVLALFTLSNGCVLVDDASLVRTK